MLVSHIPEALEKKRKRRRRRRIHRDRMEEMKREREKDMETIIKLLHGDVMSQSGGGAGAFGSLTLVFMRRNRSRETG